MSVEYHLIPTTSVQPPSPSGGLDKGFRAGDMIVWVINFPGKEMLKGTLRIGGKIQWWYVDTDGSAVAVPKDDRIWLNSNAGVNGLWKNTVVYSQDRIVESIAEFGRSVALTNESSYHEMDMGVSIDSMLEHMRYDNASYDDTTAPDYKMFSFNGYPDANLCELPFSNDIAVCLNKSNVNVRYSDVGMLKLEIILQENTKTGFRGSVAGRQYFYTMTEMEARIMTQPEQPKSEPLVLDIVQNCAVQTIQNKYSSLTFPVSQPFYSIVCGLVRNDHNSTNTNFTLYDYLSSDALQELAELVEYKLNNVDSNISFPLTHQATEILYNFILAVHGDSEKPIPHHALSYAKLSKEKGFGLGAFFGQLLPAMTTASINVLLKEEPAVPYRAYIFALGKVKF